METFLNWQRPPIRSSTSERLCSYPDRRCTGNRCERLADRQWWLHSLEWDYIVSLPVWLAIWKFDAQVQRRYEAVGWPCGWWHLCTAWKLSKPLCFLVKSHVLLFVPYEFCLLWALQTVSVGLCMGPYKTAGLASLWWGAWKGCSFLFCGKDTSWLVSQNDMYIHLFLSVGSGLGVGLTKHSVFFRIFISFLFIFQN